MLTFWMWVAAAVVLIALSLRAVFNLSPSKKWPWMVLGAVYLLGGYAIPFNLGLRHDVGIVAESTALVIIMIVTVAVLFWNAVDYHRTRNRAGPDHS